MAVTATLITIETGGPEVITAELAAAPGPRRRGLARRAWDTICSAAEWLFGLVSIVLALSVLATYPLLGLLSLGYLLESSGRIARTGRVTAGFVGVRKAARLGGVVLGTWLLLLPVRFVSSMAASARLIEPGGKADRAWSIALVVLTTLVVIQVVDACWRGGKLRHFLRPAPFKLIGRVGRAVRRLFSSEGEPAPRARDAVWHFVVGLRLPYYFWLGLRGFVGGLAWLFVPITMLAAAQQLPILGFLGAAGLVWVLLYLPFAQTRFAAENRFRAMFEGAAVRALYRKAPLAFLLALLVTLSFALPLYLLKIELLPREAAWLPSLVFVLFILPARLVTGWATGYAMRRPRNRHWLLRLPVKPAMVGVAAVYVFFVYFTQFTSWYGVGSLYEQHAFLVPVPFLEM